MSGKWNIEEGSITFWVKKNKLKWNDGAITPLVNINNDEGSILTVKDSDNKLKFFHVAFGKGRSDIEVDVSKLDETKDHMVAVTWSKKDAKNILYIDGKSVGETVNEFVKK